MRTTAHSAIQPLALVSSRWYGALLAALSGSSPAGRTSSRAARASGARSTKARSAASVGVWLEFEARVGSLKSGPSALSRWARCSAAVRWTGESAVAIREGDGVLDRSTSSRLVARQRRRADDRAWRLVFGKQPSA